MKELLQRLAAYHVWAYQNLFQTITQLPAEKHHQEVPSSFPSLYKTVLHVWDAETVWWQRLKLLERIEKPSEQFNGTMVQLCDHLIRQARQWKEWIEEAPEHRLQHVFQYRNFQHEQFKQPVYEMLLHLFNHGTYHRGQMVTMLHELGVEKIPPTDFIVWSRRKN